MSKCAGIVFGIVGFLGCLVAAPSMATAQDTVVIGARDGYLRCQAGNTTTVPQDATGLWPITVESGARPHPSSATHV